MIASADDTPTRDAGAGEDNGIRIRPVIATTELIQSRSPPKFCDKADQRFGEQSSLIEIFNQCGKSLVCTSHHHPMTNPVSTFASRFVANCSAGSGSIDQIVMVPVQIESSGSFVCQRPAGIDRHESDAGFDKFATDEIAGSAMSPPVSFASCG